MGTRPRSKVRSIEAMKSPGSQAVVIKSLRLRDCRRSSTPRAFRVSTIRSRSLDCFSSKPRRWQPGSRAKRKIATAGIPLDDGTRACTSMDVPSQHSPIHAAPSHGRSTAPNPGRFTSTTFRVSARRPKSHEPSGVGRSGAHRLAIARSKPARHELPCLRNRHLGRTSPRLVRWAGPSP